MFLAPKKCSLEKTVIQCIDYAINAKPISKYMPKNKKSYQFLIWKIVTNNYFDNFILLLIILNTVTLMIKHYSMSIEFEFMLSVTNVCFTTLFSIECTMKIFGFGPLNYFSDAWNLFDFVTVVGSLLDTSLVFLLPEDSNVNLAILRLFRAARLLKLLRQSENIRILLWTFMQSLKSLPYVCLLIFLLFFIYSIVGIQMFGNIKLDEETDINYRNNFQNFGMAMLLLFRVSTGDGWQGIMLSCLDAECDPATLKAGSTKRCGSNVAIPFFTTFIFLGSFIMLNLFVAVIMDQFEFLTKDSSVLGPHHLDKFAAAWSDNDPHATWKCKYTDVQNILTRLHPPLGMGDNAPQRLVYKRLIDMDCPLDEDGNVHFTTVLISMIRCSLDVYQISKEDSDVATYRDKSKLDAEFREQVEKQWSQLSADRIDEIVPPEKMRNLKVLTLGKIYGILLMFEHWQVYEDRRDMIRKTKFELDKKKEIQNMIQRLKMYEAREKLVERGIELPVALPKTEEKHKFDTTKVNLSEEEVNKTESIFSKDDKNQLENKRRSRPSMIYVQGSIDQGKGQILLNF